MPVTSRVPSVSVRPFEIRVAAPQDMDQLCALASELLANIHAEGTAEDARCVFDHIMNSADLGIIVVAETEGTLCGYAYGSYEWRAEFRGETTDITALFVLPHVRGKDVGGSLVAALLDDAEQLGIHRARAA